jgi:hypothetical protein
MAAPTTLAELHAQYRAACQQIAALLRAADSSAYIAELAERVEHAGALHPYRPGGQCYGTALRDQVGRHLVERALLALDVREAFASADDDVLDIERVARHLPVLRNDLRIGPATPADLRDADLRLCPIDVGFDLRTEGMVVVMPDCVRCATYGDAPGRLAVRGRADEIADVLRGAGYTVRRGE